jgi:DNA polymerase elongation subunit (family B)
LTNPRAAILALFIADCSCALLSSVSTLVFDIETSSLPVDAFDEAQQEYLFRDATRLTDETERSARRDEIQQQMSLWPLTAQVVCVAMVNADSGRGQVLYLSDDYEAQQEGESDGVQMLPRSDEAEILESFWQVAAKFEAVVTFNGRGFDVPFLYLRSAIRNVAITRKDWLGYRYQLVPHCDLAEQLTFYGVSGRDGAARRFNLDFYCKVFGLESPKSHGVTGMDVNRLLAEGRFQEIAKYCLRDVRATVELYQIWQQRLAGIR